MRALGLLLLLTAACRHAPEIRAGEPVFTRFSSPPGDEQVERWTQERAVVIRFQGGETRELSERMQGRTRESFEPLSHGGFRVTATVLEESLERNGERVPLPVPLLGVPFSHLVDRSGRFVASTDVDETLRSMRERTRDARLRRVLEAVFTPEVVATRVERSWRFRYDELCERELSPGDEFFSVEEEELPAGGTVRMLVKKTVLGLALEEGPASVELALEYGGLSSPLVREEGARKLLARSGGVRSLTRRVEGSGVRLVQQNGCHVRRESLRFEGEAQLNEQIARSSKLSGLPETLRFSVSRSLERR